MPWLCLAVGVWLALPSAAAAQTSYENVRILAVAATDANSDIEVSFDRKVCATRLPATQAQVLKARSTNHALLYSALVAAFLSNLNVRVQTSDDASCHILSLRLSRQAALASPRFTPVGQYSEGENVRLTGVSVHNSDDDDLELRFNAQVCGSGPDVSSAVLSRQLSTNFEGVASMLLTALLSDFLIKIWTENATCRLGLVWFKRTP
jgi:hypothetical protein